MNNKDNIDSKVINHSLLTKLLITVLLIITIAMLLMTSLAVNRIIKENDYHNRINIETGTILIYDNIIEHFTAINENTKALILDNNLLSLKQSYQASDPNTSTYIKLNSYIVEHLTRLENILENIVSEAVYTYEDKIFYSYTHTLRQNIDYPENTDAIPLSDLCHMYPVMDNPFFNSNEKVFPIVFTINKPKNENVIYLISINKLSNLIWSYYESIFTDMEILDAQGNIIRRSSLGIDYTNIEDVTNLCIDDRSYAITKSYNEMLEWTIYLAKDNTDMLARIHNMTTYMFGILSLVLILGYLAIIRIYSTFKTPFNQLYDLMKKNSNSFNYDHFEYQKNDEIGYLGSIYNDMIDEIESLILQLRDKIVLLEEEKKLTEYEQEQKRLAEIKALQAQINPHFLYNALNSIVWTARDENAPKAMNMTLRLANFYKTGLSKGSDTIPLKMEVEHAYNYLCIQSQRYDKIRYSFDVDEKLYNITVPKLVLQPLIENAIYHGIKPMNEDGVISISIHTDRKSVV